MTELETSILKFFESHNQYNFSSDTAKKSEEMIAIVEEFKARAKK